MFRTNQETAIKASIGNNFESGVHFHATGTGKSLIALQLLLEFSKCRTGQACHVLWICEQKSILLEQFESKTLEEKGYSSLLRQFIVFDYSRNKPESWASNVNSASAWKKPILVIINRAFLVSKHEYTHLRIPFHLIIHDECHSVMNKTTQDFYSHMLARPDPPKCLGFSATPVLEYEPFKKIQSKYTIYDACVDGIIVPPKIAWLSNQIRSDELRDLCSSIIFTQLPYRKIIVWCGMIDLCYSAAAEWRKDERFRSMFIGVDTSKMRDGSEFGTYAEFQDLPSDGLLFCAGKHREGSDILNLDGCIFLDNVAKRNHKTFIQCIGRVLRRDAAAKKTHGVILDLNAKSPMEITSRMNSYLQPSKSNPFPYAYSKYLVGKIQLNVLDVTLTPQPMRIGETVNSMEVAMPWRRACPALPEYESRLAFEMNLFKEKNLLGYLAHALDILAITKHIPHVTRGSCGSSLVCYLLGISNIDPVKYRIEFARFLNTHRSTLPDIDFDFPHFVRDDVFLQIYLKWPGRVARISNHVYYHEKSALRKAIQMEGIRKQIPALQIRNVLSRLPFEKREAIQVQKKKLINTFRTYSLHCGGIVFYPQRVPSELKLRKTGVLNQIILNKDEISKNKQFKIDILASRALSQLYEARKLVYGLDVAHTIDFDAHMGDVETAAMFMRGDNIGIILAESPLMRRTLISLKPRSMEDIAKCLAIIRPAAKKARNDPTLESNIVYDDDVIEIIQKINHCDASDADRLRRIFTKTPLKELKATMKTHDVFSDELYEACKDLRKYSFCKSHAYSYAQLVWLLGYMKAHHPKEFWKAALIHCKSSYRKWVHMYEARLAGVVLSNSTQNKSIYAKNRYTALQTASMKVRVQKLGSWFDSDDLSSTHFFPDCGVTSFPGKAEVQLRGLIASSRVLSYSGKTRSAVLLVGYGPHKYVEVVVTGSHLPIQGAIGITCMMINEKCVWKSDAYVFW